MGAQLGLKHEGPNITSKMLNKIFGSMTEEEHQLRDGPNGTDCLRQNLSVWGGGDQKWDALSVAMGEKW
jgi:hypothetical protein